MPSDEENTSDDETNVGKGGDDEENDDENRVVVMKAPKCRVCGEEHWSTQAHGKGSADAGGLAVARVAVRGPAKAVVAGRADGAPAKAKASPVVSGPVEMPDTLLVEPGLWAALKDAAAEIKRGKGRPKAGGARPWEVLGISRSTYDRRRKAGELPT